MTKIDIGAMYLGFANSSSRVFGGGEPVHERLVREIRASAGGVAFKLGPTVRELGRAAEVDTFIPLFEALNWASSLEYRIAAEWPDRDAANDWWRDQPAGETVRAIRYTRNRVHHQWAEAITIDVADLELPVRFAPWCWQQQLPPGRRDAEGERLYDTQLAGEPVLGALGRLLGVFAGALCQLSDAGVVHGDLLAELLPAISIIDPMEFTREAVTDRTPDQVPPA
jgi:hypothetical protein